LPVDKDTFLSRLNACKSLAFIPGGVQEVFMLDSNEPRELVLYLKNRKGFVKLALATGSTIVPAFGFHLDGSYSYWLPRGKWMELYSS
jgi:2-acylglycerol O-acyltransferase 2